MRWLLWGGLVLALLLAPVLTIPVAAQDEATITVTGRVVAGTNSSEALTFPMDVQLVITFNGAIVDSYASTTTEDGSFTFNDIPRHDDDYAYLVATEYAGLPQISEPVTASELEAIELVIYETSTSVNAGQIRIIDGTMIINFDKVERLGLEILLDINILNVSDRIIYGDESSYTLELPVGAFQVAPVNSGATTTGRYIIEDNQAIPVVKDTAPILPGIPHNIRLIYFLPFEAQAIIHQVFPTDITNLAIWVPTTAVQLESNYYDRGEDTVTAEGVPYYVYEQVAPISVDENGQANLIFTLGGRPDQTSNTDVESEDNSSMTYILVAVLAIVAALIIGGVAWWMGRQNVPPLES